MLFDPVRNKDVAATPEEHVRQAAVTWLTETCGVPLHLLETEFALSKISKSNTGRVDILVHGFRAGHGVKNPWLLGECKRLGESDWKTLQVQVNKYLCVLHPQHILLCVGAEWRVLSLQTDGSYTPSATLPLYPN